MAKKGLTDTWLRNKAGKTRKDDVIVSDGDALGALVRKSGTISFIYRPLLKSGKRIKMTLGKYPTMSLSDARERAQKYRKIVEAGYDPRLSREQEIKQATNEPTVDAVFAHWYETQCKVKKKSYEEHKASYENHIQKTFGSIYYKDVSTQELITHLSAMAKRIPSMTKRVWSDLDQAFDLAKEHKLSMRENPLAGIKRSKLFEKKKPKPKVALNRTEIRQIYHALDTAGFSGRNQVFFKLLLFYGCRGAELRKTKRSWLDFDKGTWTIPADSHKTGHLTFEPIVRPILPEMQHLWELAIGISETPDSFIFNKMTNAYDATDAPMTLSGTNSLAATLLKHFERKEVAMRNFSTHDIRRTARTFWIGLPGATWELCERMLGHQISEITETYDVSEHCLRMVPIYRAWWSHMTEIEEKPSQVIKLVSEG